MTDSMPELKESAEVLTNWAKATPCIRRLFIFGSRAKGTARSDSDLDVGIELDPSGNDSDAFTTFISEVAGWERHLQPLIPWTLQLEWLDSEGATPTILRGEKEACITVYERPGG